MLKSLRTQPGPHLRQLNDTVATLASDFNLSVTEEKKKAFQENVREHYLYKLVQNPEDHLCDSGVVHALATIFNTEKAARVEGANFNSYGECELDVLSSQFVGTVEKECLYQDQAYVGERFQGTFCQEVDDGHGRRCLFSMFYPTYPILPALPLYYLFQLLTARRGSQH